VHELCGCVVDSALPSDGRRTASGEHERVIITVVLRVRPAELAYGEVTGWVEAVQTGELVPVRSAWELVDVLRRLADVFPPG
jgi:hypothetical protein